MTDFTPTHAHALLVALQLHRTGRLAEAERVYRELLAREPTNADAAFYLGVLCLEAGRPDAAPLFGGRVVDDFKQQFSGAAGKHALNQPAPRILL